MAGLFDMLGGDEAAMQRQLDEQRAAQFAQQTQEQRLAGMGYKAGAGLGRGLAGAFGVDVQDPALKQAAELRRMAQDYDISSPEGLMQMAQAIRTTNPQAAIQLAEKAQSMMQSLSVTSKNMREKQAADPFQKLLESGKYTTPSMKKYKESGDVGDLETVDKADPTVLSETADGVFLINKVTGQKIARIGSAPERATKVSVNNAQESAFAKERGQLQAKTLAEVETQAKASANAVDRLSNMEKLNKGSLITGPLAGSAIGAGQFLSSLGLLSPESAKTLASSEVYDKQAKDLVMQDLGGKLGAQISNADREFIEARIPQLRNSQPARTELINKLKEIHKKNINYYQRMSKEATTKGNLNDFDFASGAPDNKESNKPATATKRFNPATGKIEAIGG